MKQICIILLSVFSASRAVATLDVQCGPKGNETYQASLHIEDDSSVQPKHWSFLLNGKKPYTISPAELLVSRRKLTVTLNNGGDSVWTDYKFALRGECDSETYNQELSIYRRTLDQNTFLERLSCKCMED